MAAVETIAADYVAQNIKLFDLVLGSAPGYRCLTELPEGRQRFYPANTDLARAVQQCGDRPGVYYGTALYREAGSRTAANVKSRRVFCLDIDAGPDKFAKHGDAVYPDGNAATAALVGAVNQVGLKPTLVIKSGPHGLHVYFCLTEDLSPAEWTPLAQDFKLLMSVVGLKADLAVTADVTRVLRPIGTRHHSGHTTRLVADTGHTTTPEDFGRRVRDALAKFGAVVRDAPAPAARHSAGPTQSRNVALMVPTDDGFTEHTVAELRSALLHLATKGHGASYDEWVAQGQALRSLKGTPWETDALALWLAYCEACPGFDGETAARAKWAQLGGDHSHWKVVFATAREHGWRGMPAQLVTAAAVGGNDAEAPDADDPEAIHATDRALSVIWVDREGPGFRFDHTRGGWLHFEGGAWRTCTKGQHQESFKGLAALLLAEAGKELAKSGGDERRTASAKRYMAAAMRAQSAAGTRAALSLAESAPGVAVTSDEFDRDPDLINCANGAAHLPTGELRPRDSALLLHRQSPIEFHPGAECPQFLAFMNQITCGDADLINYLQRWCGYTLSGHVGEERAAFWLGNGANGKSVLANILRLIMGDYAASAPASLLMQGYRNPGAATPELAMLQGVRLLMANEVEAGSRLSAQTLKVVTSTEHIAARPLYGNPFSFKPTHKVIVRGNHRPIIADDDEGIWRRIDLIPFDLNLRPDQRDPTLEARLAAEAPGILAWMVRGYAMWRRDGLKPCKRVRDASLAYRKDSDLLGQWIDDACDTGPQCRVAQGAAYAVYKQWCQDQGLRQPAKRSFTRSLRERGIGEARESTGNRPEVYTGIRLKT